MTPDEIKALIARIQMNADFYGRDSDVVRLANALEAALSPLPDEQLDEIERVARIVKQVSTAYGGRHLREFADDPPLAKHYAIADAILRALSSRPDEETVTTVEELDAMPVGSVVMEVTTEPFLGIPTVAGVFHKFPAAVQEPGRTPDEGWREWFVVAGHGARPASEIMLPARLLFRPTPEGSETA